MKKRNLIKRILMLASGGFMFLPLCTARAIDEEKGFIMPKNLSLKKAVIANNSYGAQPKESAVDGDRFTIWRTLTNCKDPFVSLIIPLLEKTDINLVYLKPYMYDRMTSVKIQYTTDPTPSAASEWLDLKTFVGDEISDSMIANFDTVTATGIRFYADVTQHFVGLYEIELYYTDDIEAATYLLLNPPAPTPKEFSQGKYVNAEIVSVGENGELIYKEYDEKGSTLIDFSRVGYKKGEKPIPDVKVVKTIEPGDLADHTALIQGAIDEVAALPLEERGAILLRAGTYTVSGMIKITASGIVLRGEGQGENGTVIYDGRKEHCHTLTIKGSGSYTEVPDTLTDLADSCVRVGELKLELSENISKYNVGDNICVICKPNDLWIQTLGMDNLPEGKKQWAASEYVTAYERTVTDVDKTNNTVTIDTAIPLTLDNRYYAVTIEKIEDSSGRITECGVENIRFLSYYDQTVVDEDGNLVDENHGWTAVRFENCRDCFLRDVSVKHYGYSTATAAEGAINVTVEGCSYLEPVSLIKGSRRYSFYLGGGQYILFKNCYSQKARHDYVLGARNKGPNVFLNSIADDSYGVSEPHHRWSTGTLFDNIYHTGRIRLGDIQVVNRGKEGTGHGWSGANSVIWNALSPAILVGKPQTEQNFAVGAYGIFNSYAKAPFLDAYNHDQIKPTIETPNYPETKNFENSPMYGNGYIEAAYNPANPSSLYKAQLSYRLYGDARKNVVPCAPILNYPATDEKIEARCVTVSGVADQSAEKVLVYVNGEKREANIAENSAYSLELNLENGYYDVYVTQVIDGIESDRNAIRTFLVDSKDA